jgi:AcrR family transcriptional regulator
MSPRKAAALRDGGDRTLREHLVAAAARLIARHGTAGLTVRAIAREAEVADGVLYNHFTDKEELLALALHSHVETVMSSAPPPPSAGEGTVEENLRAHTTRSLGVLIAILPAFAGVFSQPKVLAGFTALPIPGEAPLHSALARYLRDEQRLGRVNPAANVDAAVAMVLGACHELVLPHVFYGSPATELTVPPGFVDQLVTTLVHGIAPAAN